MKFDSYKIPKSSFLTVPKDIALIMNQIMENENILKLLYYNSEDALKKSINADQIKELLDNKQLDSVPDILINDKKLSYLRIAFSNFLPNADNPEYRDHVIEIKIMCHYDTWHLENLDLRPYRIAGEIDALLEKTHLNGIGLLLFLSADPDTYDYNYGGITLRYLAICGNEDKLNPLE